jgi:predicted PurR-regulated permease PerM
MSLSGRIKQNRDLLWSVGLCIVLAIVLLGAVWLLLYLLSKLAGVFLVVFLGIFIAFILSPLVKMLNRIRLPQVISTILSFLAFLAFFIILFYLLVPTVVQELVILRNNLPTILDSIKSGTQAVDQFLRGLGLGLSFDQVYAQLETALGARMGDIVSQALTFGLGLVNVITQGMFVLLIAFFLTKDWPYLRGRFHDFLGRHLTPRSQELFTGVSRTVGRYLRSLLLVATVVGVLDGVGTALLGIPYAWVLGILGFLGELIPYFGPFLSLIGALILSLGKPWVYLLYIILLYGGIQAFQNYLFSPLVMAGQMGFHPLAVIIAVLIGGALFGIWGVILAVPMLSVGRYLISFFLQPAPVAKPPERSSPHEQPPD